MFLQNIMKICLLWARRHSVVSSGASALNKGGYLHASLESFSALHRNILNHMLGDCTVNIHRTCRHLPSLVCRNWSEQSEPHCYTWRETLESPIPFHSAVLQDLPRWTTYAILSLLVQNTSWLVASKSLSH